MNLEDLRHHIEKLSDSLGSADKDILSVRLSSLASVFPFNEYEYMLMFLLSKKAITFQEYEKLRGSYISANRCLDLFELAPRIFGEIWAQ